MKRLICTLIILFSAFLTFSQTTIHIPGDYLTIQEGINAANNGDLVLVDEDTYYENIDFIGKAITVASHFYLDGDTSHISNTFIDGSQPANPNVGSTVLFFRGEDTSSVLCGFTITGGTGVAWGSYKNVGGGVYIYNSSPIIRNNIIENIHINSDGHVGGSAIFFDPSSNSAGKIENNTIRNNTMQSTMIDSWINGTILISAVTSGSLTIRNNIISDNALLPDQTNLYCNGGAISAFGYDNPTFTLIIENNIISNNLVRDEGANPIGGGMHLNAIDAVVRNNIIAFNSAKRYGGIHYANTYGNNVSPVVVNNTIVGNTATSTCGGISTHYPYWIQNCIIWGNSSPQYYGSSATIDYSNLEESYSNGSNNISFQPEFLDSTTFFLCDTSHCIDKGNPASLYKDIEDPGNPGFALYPAMGTLTNDIGHCGGPYSNWWKMAAPVEIDETETGIPTEFILSQNYPNPFNPSTTIKYAINKRSFVELKVYDILGNEIETLVNDEQDIGFYKIEINAYKLSSGVYFCQLKAGDYVTTKKMILLK